MEALMKNISAGCSKEDELNLYVKTFNDADANLRSEIINLIKKNHPNHSNDAMYQKNITLIKEYPHIRKDFPKFEDIDIHILYCSPDFLLYHVLSRNELILKKYSSENERALFPRELYLFKNEMNIFRLLDIRKRTRLTEDSDAYSPRPLYLYYDNKYYFTIFTVSDISPLLKHECALFFFSEDEMKDFFSDFYCAFPSVAPEEFKPLLYDYRVKRQEKLNEIKHSIKEYYQENSDKVLENVVNGRPRILFLSTLLGFAERNTMSDLAQGFVNCGYEVKVHTHKSRIHLFSGELASIDSFKPDIIVTIDTVKHPFPELGKEIVHINWIQDPLVLLEFGERDFFLEHCPVTFSDISRINVPTDRIIDGQLRANPEIYRLQTLTKEEEENYSCDVVLAIGNGNIRVSVCGWINHFMDEYFKLNNIDMDASKVALYKQCIPIMFDTFYELIYNEKYNYYDFDKNREITDSILQDNIPTSDYDQPLVDFLIENVQIHLISELYRLVIAAWVKDLGDIKLNIWGVNWEQDENFKPYAKGINKSREMLSRIYTASKITIGNNYYISCPGRFFESTLSGCLFIGNTLPESVDISIETIKRFKENEITFFKTKKELHEKIRFYLQNGEERKALNERSCQRILKEFTYDSLVENAMSQIREVLKKQL